MNDAVKNNKQIYQSLWNGVDILKPSIWSTWSVVRKYSNNGYRLELGPGNKPKIPIKGSYFIDLNEECIKKLKQKGGFGYSGDISKINFPSKYFGLVCAFDVIEHINNDKEVFEEISRVLKPGGVFILSAPFHMRLWSDWDNMAGHVRRYNPKRLYNLLRTNGFIIEKYSNRGSIKSKRLNNFFIRIFNKNRRFFVKIHPFVIVSSSKFLGLLRIYKWEQGDFLNKAKNMDGAILVCTRV